MRWRWSAVAIAVLAAAAFAADETQHLALLPCPTESREPACNPSKIDLKKSKAAFSKALHLQKAEHFDEAYQEFDTAARLVPKNVEYVTALALVRQQLVFDHLQRGNDDLAKGKLVEAQAQFRSASNLDPENEFAQQRLRDSLTEWTPKTTGAATSCGRVDIGASSAQPGSSRIPLPRGLARSVDASGRSLRRNR